MRWFVRIVAVLLILIVALVFTLNFYLGAIVIKAAETAGSSALGVPVKLAQANFQLLQGRATLRGFILGNPQGFKTANAISVGEITVVLDPKTLLSDTIVIKRIYVNAPEITYELGMGKSNIGKILDQASGPTETNAVEPAKKEQPSGKKVVIDDFLIENGRIRISTTLAMGAAAPIPLPSIHLTDIGKEKQGASPLEVTKQVLGAIAGSVTKVVTGAVGLVGDGAKAVGGAAVSVAKDTAGLVGDGAQAVGKGAKAAGGAAVSAVEGTAGAVGDGAKAVGHGAEAVGGAVMDAGSAVGKGASKIVGDVTGLFKSDKPTNDPPRQTPAP